MLFCRSRFSEDKSIKKIINIALVIFSVLLLAVSSVYMAFQSRVVQTFIINTITRNISESTGADVSISKVRISFFDKIIFDDVFLSDQQKDTLFYAEKFTLSIDTISLPRKLICINTISLDKPKVCLEKLDSNSYNFSFLLNADSTRNTSWKICSKNIKLRDGQFDFKDDKLKQEYIDFLEFKEIDLDVDHVEFNSPQSFSFNLNEFSLKSKNGFWLKNFNANVHYSDSTFCAGKIIGKTSNSSLIVDSVSVSLNQFFQSQNPFDIAVDLHLSNLNLGFKDVAFLFPTYYGDGLDVALSGRFYGKISDVKAKNLAMSLGNVTRLNGDFSLSGLPDADNSFIFANLNESFADLNELRKLDLPIQLQSVISKFPKFLDNIGLFKYKGNFTGFKNDFVAYGTLSTDLGRISGDLSFKPLDAKWLKLEGHVETNGFDLGGLLNTSNVGGLALSGKVDGAVCESQYDLKVDGVVRSIDVNDYNFQNINLKGNLKNKLFDGNLSIDDPNIKMFFSGSLDLSPELPVFEFVADVERANLFNLNILKDSVSIASMSIDANFEGNNIDNIKGQIKLKELKYRNSVGSLALSNAIINNISSGDSSLLTVKSDWLDGEIKGHYNLMNIANSLRNFYRNYLPSTIAGDESKTIDVNDFTYHINVKNSDPITKILNPDLVFKQPFDIVGFYHPLQSEASLETQIPYVSYGKQYFENLKIKFDATSELFDCRIKSEKLSLAQEINIYNVSFDTKGKNDQLFSSLNWNNFAENTYSGSIKATTSFIKSETKYPQIIINVDPSNIYIADSLWVLNGTTVKVDSTSFKFDDLSLTCFDQRLRLDGNISHNPTSTAYLTTQNVDLSLFGPFIGNSIDGRLDGKASLTDAFNKFIVDFDLKVRDFSAGTSIFGDLNVKCKWNPNSEKLLTNLSLTDKSLVIAKGDGYIDLNRLTADVKLNFDNSPISLLGVLMPFLFYNVTGNVNGEVDVSGDLAKLNFDGKLTPVSEVGLGINFLKTNYTFSDPVYFRKDSVLFKSMVLKDEYGNKGTLNGSITHKSFINDYGYDMKITANKICAMNTTSYDVEQFYGTIFGSGTLLITGKNSDVLLSGDFKTEKGTSINIPVEGTESAEKYDFVEFVTNKETKVESKSFGLITSGLNMSFDVEITPEAKVQIIFNSQMGDILKGEGSGDIQVRMDKDYNLNLYGNYVIDKGDYLFTFQNVINKKFAINKGGTIKWLGDPYNAQIDVTAVYRVKTSLYDLFLGSNQNIDLARRLPVDCIISLTDNLQQPVIDFDIDLPTAEERIKDEVDQLIVTKEDINKQIISLMFLGRFYTPDFFAGAKQTTMVGSDAMGTTASELFSNQLTNWLSEISDVVDFGINYRPRTASNTEMSSDRIEVALSTQILNDRVTIDGNLANNTNQNKSNSGDFVGDFDINVKLTDNGKLQFKAYTHSNDNIIEYEDMAKTKQGIGFSYREEFNTFKELFQMYKNALFGKKNKKKVKVEPKSE